MLSLLLPFLTFIPLGFLALLGILVLVSLGPIRRGERMAKESAAWPTATGKVLVSEMRPGRGLFSRIRKQQVPHVEYEYYVSDTRYRSGIISMGDLPGAPTDITRFPVGSAVKVYYFQENPALAILIPGGSVIREFIRELLLPLGLFVLVMIVVFGVFTLLLLS